jgi:hypothetical protein
MKNSYFLLMTLLILTSTAVLADKAEAEREARQAELDAACEATRETKLAIVRAELAKECVDTGQLSDLESCEQFYADYGMGSFNQAPLFYDLPECEIAFEYLSSYRS